MIEKIPILPLGTDGDCPPVVIKLQRFPMVATKPPALALGEVVFTSTAPAIINAALPHREAKRLKVLKPATSETKNVNVDTLPSAQLEIGQSFSVQGREGTFTVVDKTVDPRCQIAGKFGPLAPAYWIITDSAELQSFHTGQIPNVCAVVKVTPPKQVVEIIPFPKLLTLEDVCDESGKPSIALLGEAWRDKKLTTPQYQALIDAYWKDVYGEAFTA